MKTLKISALYINLRNWNKQLHVFYSIVLFIIVVIKKSYFHRCRKRRNICESDA